MVVRLGGIVGIDPKDRVLVDRQVGLCGDQLSLTRDALAECVDVYAPRSSADVDLQLLRGAVYRLFFMVIIFGIAGT